LLPQRRVLIGRDPAALDRTPSNLRPRKIALPAFAAMPSGMGTYATNPSYGSKVGFASVIKQMELQIMATTFYITLATIVGLGTIAYLFIIEPRSKVHDL
jgi:hypothetical protein